LGVCTAAGSAGVRLLGLDPYAVQHLLSGLGPEIDRVAAEVSRTAAAGALDLLPADGAPALELVAEVHARSEVRLFAS
jgi:urease accessory protein